MRQRLTLFLYSSKGAAIHHSTIRDKLLGYSEIRVVRTETGGTKHKTYSYPGVFSKIWCRDLIRGAFIVEARHEAVVIDLFKKYRVPYVRAAVKEINTPEKLGAV